MINAQSTIRDNTVHSIYGKTSASENLPFEWKIAIHSKPFTVTFLYTYITDQQGHT